MILNQKAFKSILKALLHIKHLIMKKFTAEEAQNLKPLPSGRYSLVYSLILQLQPGEALLITPKDWVTKTTPYQTIRKVIKNTGYKLEYGRMPDGSGWLVKRVG